MNGEKIAAAPSFFYVICGIGIIVLLLQPQTTKKKDEENTVAVCCRRDGSGGRTGAENLKKKLAIIEKIKSKGRIRDIIYIYTTDHGYVEWDDFKAHSKELNHDHVGDMSLDELQTYATQHRIPELAPSQLQAIKALKKKR